MCYRYHSSHNPSRYMLKKLLHVVESNQIDGQRKDQSKVRHEQHNCRKQIDRSILTTDAG